MERSNLSGSVRIGADDETSVVDSQYMTSLDGTRISKRPGDVVRRGSENVATIQLSTGAG